MRAGPEANAEDGPEANAEDGPETNAEAGLEANMWMAQRQGRDDKKSVVYVAISHKICIDHLPFVL